MNLFHQGLLRYLTSEQLALITSQRVGIGGAGGLGSNVAVILVRSGFTHLEILDQPVKGLYLFRMTTDDSGRPRLTIYA